ncbi:MAG: DUF1854 domain-containing protein [Candidatus Latescibacterota bacterium]|jgi:hypothetical protein
MEEPLALDGELNLLEAGRVRLRHDEYEDLVLELDGGETNHEVQVRRSFPLSAQEEYLSLRDSDGRELGIIRHLAELDPVSRRALATELEKLYFVPQIVRVLRIEERFHVPRWEVETDRGPRVFEIRSGRSDVRVLTAGRVLIRDADGNPYEIQDYRQLDQASQDLIEGQI